eukprot:CFRG7882T1
MASTRQPESSVSRGPEGVKMIPIETPCGIFNVWTRKVGNNSKIKVLLLHGGPGFTSEYLEPCEPFLVDDQGYEIYYYHQLGSHLSDQPNDDALWDVDRFVDEVEQVRVALGINKDNGYILGNSWGGLLAMEYGIKYPQSVKALVVANMVSSIKLYTENNVKLRARMGPEFIAQCEIYENAEDYSNPEYEKLLMEYYAVHLCRIVPFPDGLQRSMDHCNQHIYEYLQGPNEFVVTGTLLTWDITKRLHAIKVPTLMVGAAHDSMDCDAMKRQAGMVQNGRYLHCPNGSHVSLYDDQASFFEGVVKFIKDVHTGTFIKDE